MSSKISMAIDVKKNRLRIHQATLKHLGNPPYLQLLFSPQKEAIVVLKRERQVPNGQEVKVVMDHKNRPGSCDLSSKELVTRIRRQFSGMEEEGLYRLAGFELPDEGGVCFPLNTLAGKEDVHGTGDETDS